MLSILRLVLSLCLCGYDFPLSLLFMIGFLGWFLIFYWPLLILKVCCLCIWWEVSCLWCWCCFQFIFYHWICCSNFWQYSHWCCFCNSFSVLINLTTFKFFGGGGIFCVDFVAYFSISGDDISEFQCFLWLWYCCLFQFYYLFLVCLIICCLLPQYGDISVWFIFFFAVISVLFKKLYFLLLEFLSMILMLFQPIITFLFFIMKKCHWLCCLRLCIFCI